MGNKTNSDKRYSSYKIRWATTCKAPSRFHFVLDLNPVKNVVYTIILVMCRKHIIPSFIMHIEFSFCLEILVIVV